MSHCGGQHLDSLGGFMRRQWIVLKIGITVIAHLFGLFHH